ncbi:MAG: hypothetical protein UT86_C0004G0067 [Candidatus Magasanikbacteria bacterium GW2011_GWC2_40_17]|uniref:Uncharacterized protein n=1 Tax=Candidatus Magasanikbacteria bacterium GW2011_GWA2_42_32 TaxID=1619039 RepID=A0A0G1A7W4_9BACT|nr:MAG: hypothetical protein UT86_C0004G0067 [Candidatus Magasanikbacteria bacterium GW2011_GWC2_40_17]KKS57125.1 MAG: hypothetical protein UV20_C0003G0067 [Candidatus Magasanikbacteria bacterium GW2011_GWA2_42_32]
MNKFFYSFSPNERIYGTYIRKILLLQYTLILNGGQGAMPAAFFLIPSHSKNSKIKKPTKEPAEEKAKA